MSLGLKSASLSRTSIGDVSPRVQANEKVKTKIICTIGPSTKSKQMLASLMEAGMSIVRLNFSHGDHSYHGEIISNLREHLNETQRLCAVLLDTKGPEIRTGKLEDGKAVTLKTGENFTFYCNKDYVGNSNGVGIDYDLTATVAPTDKILVDDGLIGFTVSSVAKDSVCCTVDNGGELGQTKGVNLPGLTVNLPAVTEKDKVDIAFGVENNVDFIAASFIRKADDVRVIRDLPGVREQGIRIISKIESQEGIDNFDEILAESDAIMVARGDLGVEVPIEKVSTYQKRMIKKCNKAGKPVVTATQMLDSMTNNPRPTRAEATDVANAVYDGTDAVMLSGETANGSWPVETVSMMAKICKEAESQIDYRTLYLSLRKEVTFPHSIPDSVASSAVKSSWDIQAALIICLTESGSMCRLISKYRPHTMMLAITNSPTTATQCMLSRSSIPMLTDTMKEGTEEIIQGAIFTCLNDGMIHKGDKVVVTSGTIQGISGSTNIMKIIEV